MNNLAQAQAQQQAPPQQQQAAPQQVPQGGDQVPGGLEGEGDPLAGIPPEILAQINGLAQNPQFMELRQYARQNPQTVIPQIAIMIQQSNPQLWAFFEQNKELFVSLILGAPAGSQGGQGQPQAENPNAIRLSQGDSDAIDRLMSFGFEKYACAEAYLVCDKNEEMALSMLFDNADKFNAEAMTGVAPAQPPAQPQNPAPQEPAQPQNPAPQEPAPQNPAPENPAPQEPAPQNNDNPPADSQPEDKKSEDGNNKMDQE